MLTLPAETSDAGGSISFEHGNYNSTAAHLCGLFVPNGQQGAVRDRLYEAVAQGIG